MKRVGLIVSAKIVLCIAVLAGAAATVYVLSYLAMGLSFGGGLAFLSTLVIGGFVTLPSLVLLALARIIKGKGLGYLKGMLLLAFGLILTCFLVSWGEL
jgi:hypothetical protein